VIRREPEVLANTFCREVCAIRPMVTDQAGALIVATMIPRNEGWCSWASVDPGILGSPMGETTRLAPSPTPSE